VNKKEKCPTCGAGLGRLQGAELWRTCNSCNRISPSAQPYCGWCAAPLENTEMRKRLAEVATPPGGWPSLARELLEVRFFMQNGKVADAFELLAILRQRHPLHPELEEYTERARPGLAADTGVQRVVDAVMADSSGLSGTAVAASETPKEVKPEAPLAAPPKRKGKRGKKKSKTSRYDRVDKAAPTGSVPIAIPDPLPPRERAPKAFGRGDTQPLDAADIAAVAPPESPPAGAVPKAFGRGDTEPLDEADIAAMTPTPQSPPAAAGVLYSEPATEEAAAQARGRQLAAAAEAERAAEQAAFYQQVAQLADQEDTSVEAIARVQSEAAKEAEPPATEAHAESVSERAAAEAARIAVEEAVSELPDRPGAQTGSTQVGPAPLAPVVAARVSTPESSKAPRTGDTDVGMPVVVAPVVTGDTNVGPVPTTAPGDTNVGPVPTTAPAVTGNTDVIAVPIPPSAPPTTQTAVGPAPTGEPPKGLTIAVDALEPAAPFSALTKDDKPRRRKSRAQSRKRAMKARKRSGKQSAVDEADSETERKDRSRRRAARFGQGIVGK